MDLTKLFDLRNILQGLSGRQGSCPRPFADLARQSGLRGSGVEAVTGFERLWAQFVDEVTPIAGTGAAALMSGDWSGMSQDKLTDMLQVWKVWTRYRDRLEKAARQLNPLTKGGRGIDPRVTQAAQAQLHGFNAFRQSIAITEEREKKGAFAHFKDWLTSKTSDLKHEMQHFNLDEWAETGWGQVAVGAAAAGFVAMMNSSGDVQGYSEQRQLPPRERFGRWAEIEARYPGAAQIESPAPKSTTRLGYGTVIGRLPDGRVVFQSAVSLWVVAPDDL